MKPAEENVNDSLLKKKVLNFLALNCLKWPVISVVKVTSSIAYGWNGFHRLDTVVHGVKSRKRVLNIGAMCEFDQNGDTFSVCFW